MPIGGLVISLVEDPAAAAAAVLSLAAQPDLELGERVSTRRLPAVLQTPSIEASRERLRELTELPGVLHVDVVHVAFDPDEPVRANPLERAPGPRRRAVPDTPEPPAEQPPRATPR